MVIVTLKKWLIPENKQSLSTNTYFWLALSLFFAILYGCLSLRQSFSTPLVIQDDARQHVFWMQRFLDPALFPNDLIADYFQSVAPVGYKKVYQLANVIGINPLIFSKILPLILGIITTVFGFYFCLQIFPIPFASFASMVILNQSLWMTDDLASGTPRAFIYPLLLGFLYMLARKYLFGCIFFLVLQGLFYPQAIFLSIGTLALQLLIVTRKGFRISLNYGSGNFFIICFITAIFVLLPYALKTSEYGPVITATAARLLPEFQAGGRSSFFVDDFWKYWISGDRSGIFYKTILTPFTLVTALFLPFICLFPNQFALVKAWRSQGIVLLHLTVASVAMFFLAHLALYRLHLPSRYTEHSFRIILAILAGISLVILVDYFLKWAIGKAFWQKIVSLLAVIVIISSLIGYPLFMESFLDGNYITSDLGELYNFISQQPKDIIIASTSPEAANIPTFAGRSVLVSMEHAIPYHTGYYQEIRQRYKDIIQAQYSPKISDIKRVTQKYNISFWLLDDKTFNEKYLAKNRFLNQFQPETKQAFETFQIGKKSALLKLKENCTSFSQQNYLLVDSECLMNSDK